MRLTAVGLILIVVAFSFLEIGRWKKPDLADLLTPLQKGRRIVGLVLLLVLGIMLYGGTYWPDVRLMPEVIRDMEAIYWLLFALLTVFVPLIAFFEFKDSLIRASQLRRQTYHQIVTTPLDQLPHDTDQTKKKQP